MTSTGPRRSPAPGRRAPSSTRDRRADILEAGLGVYRTIGFTDAKVSDITAAAGIAKGTFYLYFETKDHVLGALWERHVDAVVRTAEDILGQGQAWWPTVDRLLTALVQHAVDNAELHRIVYSTANAKALEMCRSCDERVIRLMTAFAARGTHAGAFHAANPQWACRMLYHATHSLLHHLITAGGPIDTGPVVRSVLEAAHRTLAAPDPL
ncbi:TetR/AcrR family transcriptional regulator [Streptomyces broussonetiae]|uniref:TetR/AcrR family transcriptional regulator n=1 Tax=Streptomyces broussonetiae TaxID=2686304 RepID=UPI0035DEC61A